MTQERCACSTNAQSDVQFNSEHIYVKVEPELVQKLEDRNGMHGVKQCLEREKVRDRNSSMEVLVYAEWRKKNRTSHIWVWHLI